MNVYAKLHACSKMYTLFHKAAVLLSLMVILFILNERKNWLLQVHNLNLQIIIAFVPSQFVHEIITHAFSFISNAYASSRSKLWILCKNSSFPIFDKWTPSLWNSSFWFHVISGYCIYYPPDFRHNHLANMLILTAARFRDLMFWSFSQKKPKKTR